MTLWLHKRADHPGENYVVTCGECTVGVISQSRQVQPYRWHWSITAFYIEPLKYGGGSGSADTREQAMAAFATRFRAWLGWAGLRELDEGEMQIGEEGPKA